MSKIIILFLLLTPQLLFSQIGSEEELQIQDIEARGEGLYLVSCGTEGEIKVIEKDGKEVFVFDSAHVSLFTRTDKITLQQLSKAYEVLSRNIAQGKYSYYIRVDSFNIWNFIRSSYPLISEF